MFTIFWWKVTQTDSHSLAKFSTEDCELRALPVAITKSASLPAWVGSFKFFAFHFQKPGHKSIQRLIMSSVLVFGHPFMACMMCRLTYIPFVHSIGCLL